MIYASIILMRLNADLVAMAAKAMRDAWLLRTPNASRSYGASAPGNLDLTTLGLDRMPPSGSDLRMAYRRAAKAAHPDAGGNADAFRAVSEAFRRLARSSPPAV
jgi:hypothetical protein